MGRHANGEGSIYHRKDGRYEAAAYLLTTSGTRKRVRVYGRTRADVHNRLTEAKAKVQAGTPIPDRQVRLGEYLDYWLEQVVKPNKRPATYDQYAWVATKFLKSDLGNYRIDRLTVHTVQAYFNQKSSEGYSAHRVRLIRMVLSSALTRALREELITRNVARLVDLPSYQAQERRPWSGNEAKAFLDAVKEHPLYPAFLLLFLYGLRRGEVLGLRWKDVDFERGELRIRNQLHRANGMTRQGPVKTKAGQRDLPLVRLTRDALQMQRSRCMSFVQPDGLVFLTPEGHSPDPDSFTTSFQRLARRHGLRVIRVHDVRHTQATLLKKLGVPARDAQLILGHSDIATTQQIYQHDDMASRLEALGKIEKVFMRTVGSASLRCRQFSRQTLSSVELLTSLISGTPGEIRTHDLWYRNSFNPGIAVRVTEVNSLLNACRRQWLVGIVAVKIAVSFGSSFVQLSLGL